MNPTISKERRPKKKHPPEVRERVFLLNSQGIRVSGISKELNIPPSTVATMLKKRSNSGNNAKKLENVKPLKKHTNIGNSVRKVENSKKKRPVSAIHSKSSNHHLPVDHKNTLPILQAKPNSGLFSDCAIVSNENMQVGTSQTPDIGGAEADVTCQVNTIADCKKSASSDPVKYSSQNSSPAVNNTDNKNAQSGHASVNKAKNSAVKVADKSKTIQPGPWSNCYITSTNSTVTVNAVAVHKSDAVQTCLVNAAGALSQLVASNDMKTTKPITYLKSTLIDESSVRHPGVVPSLAEGRPTVVNLNTNSDVHALIKEATGDKSHTSANRCNPIIVSTNSIQNFSDVLTSSSQKKLKQDVNENASMPLLDAQIVAPLSSRTTKANVVPSTISYSVITHTAQVPISVSSVTSVSSTSVPSVTLTYIPTSSGVKTSLEGKARVLNMSKENVRLIKEVYTKNNSLSAICAAYADDEDSLLGSDEVIPMSTSSEDNNCSRKLEINSSQESDSAIISENEDFYGAENDVVINDNQEIQGVTECLTISSSDEEEIDNGVSENQTMVIDELKKKEPVINEEKFDEETDDSQHYYLEMDSEFEDDISLNLMCRTVRFGSLKVVPYQDVIFSRAGIKIWIPNSSRNVDSIFIKIPFRDIVKILIHFGQTLPVVFVYTTPHLGVVVRKTLSMSDPSGFYFNPSSKNELHKRITLLPEKITDSMKNTFYDLFAKSDGLLQELTDKEANEILVRSSPTEVQRMVKQQVSHNLVQTIMVYPPPPAKGGISINTEDYACLSEDVFLNDVIIDFYLKFLMNEYKPNKEDQSKIHIFSSFFYKRLTDKATPRQIDSDKGLKPAEIRHSRVKSWTKNIDLFSKDFIIIPINENSHWFLAIICFPGLDGPVRMVDDEPLSLTSPKVKPKPLDNNADLINDSSNFVIGSTTITPIKQNNSSSVYPIDSNDNSSEERDEADGKDEDVDYYYSENEESAANTNTASDQKSSGVNGETVKDLHKEKIKQPCILIFDSLAGASRARIIATLRDYLKVEYKVKHNGEERDFSKNVVKGDCPKVPQQDNFTDCGLFLLEYVETFLREGIADFRIPVTCLKNWFHPKRVSRKRFQIQQLIHSLMQEQGIDAEKINLPILKVRCNKSQLNDRYFDEDDLDEYSSGEFGDIGEDDDLYDDNYMEDDDNDDDEDDEGEDEEEEEEEEEEEDADDADDNDEIDSSNIRRMTYRHYSNTRRQQRQQNDDLMEQQTYRLEDFESDTNGDDEDEIDLMKGAQQDLNEEDEEEEEEDPDFNSSDELEDDSSSSSDMGEVRTNYHRSVVSTDSSEQNRLSVPSTGSTTNNSQSGSKEDENDSPEFIYDDSERNLSSDADGSIDALYDDLDEDISHVNKKFKSEDD